MVEEVILQEEKKEEKKEIEEKKGYYLAEVPTNFAKVIVFEKKEIPFEELLIKMANALTKAGLMK